MTERKANNKILKNQLKIGIIGAGRVGSNLTFWLARTGWHIKSIYSRTREHALEIAKKVPTGISETIEEISQNCDVVIITVPDSAIQSVAEEIADANPSRVRTIIHCSGLLSSKILDLSGTIFARASMHPLASIPTFSPNRNPFLGVYFGIEGDKWALEIVENFVYDLGGATFRLHPEQKVLYHTIATLVAGGIYILGDLANKVWSKASDGVPPVLLFEKLVQSAIENQKKSAIERVITGPIARADTEAVMMQLSAIRGTEYEQLYLLIGEQIAKIAGTKKWWDEMLQSFYSVSPKN